MGQGRTANVTRANREGEAREGEAPAEPPRQQAQSATAWRRSLAKKILAWFRLNARDLPWRRTRDLYAIWLSEVMLQQTQVITVIPYWQRFLARFPAACDLAVADEREVLRHWEGLGYYRRARQLHAAAQQIVAEHQGAFPTSYEAVRALPGIGRYTAGAILSIGLDQRLPILEANTIRVLSRLTAFTGDPASTTGQKYLWSVADQILPAKECGAFNQALMELGSEICTPKSPACNRCPVAALCQARQEQLIEQIPRPAKRTNYEDRTEIAVVIRRRGRILVRHCQPGERWAGLWDFPRFVAAKEGLPITEQLAAGVRPLIGCDVTPGPHITTIKHGVTRFRITLHCYEATLLQPPKRIAASGTLQWVAINQLADYPLSTTGRTIAKLLGKPRRQQRRLAITLDNLRH